MAARNGGGKDEAGTVSRLELVVAGVPASQQSKPRTRERWQEVVRQAARGAIPEEQELYGECRGVLVYFYFASTDLDVDNIIKPISDALAGIAYFDDRLISEWVVRKTDLGATEIVDPPPALSEHLSDRLAAAQPFVYICVTDQGPNHAELPK